MALVEGPAPPPQADEGTECADDEDVEEVEFAGQNFAELLGPDCVIKRVDKDKNVIGGAKPEEFQQELMSRAQSQKRLGACAEHVKGMSRQDKLAWAVDLKDRANEFYAQSSFEEAARLYNDCLVALDLDGTEEEVREVQFKLQLPICTNLAACMVEMGQYSRVAEICEIALSVDPNCCKALYRRGLARYRIGDHNSARPDFEAALQGITKRRESGELAGDEVRSFSDLQRRIVVYLGHIRRFTAEERQACKRMFERGTADDRGGGGDGGLYADRPGARVEDDGDGGPIDDSDDALDSALARARGDWTCCPCRRRAERLKDD